MRKVPVDLNAMVQAVIAELQPELKTRKVEWSLQQLSYISGDRALLYQVFLNLLANAVKYTRTRAEARMQVFAIEQDDEIIVGVKDNGVGFANVRRIVQRHGGRTRPDSVLNDGATFYFSLPAPDKAECAMPAPSPTVEGHVPTDKGE